MAGRRRGEIRVEDMGGRGAVEAGFSPAAGEAAKGVVEYQRPQRRNLNELVGQTVIITGYRLSESAKFKAQVAYVKVLIDNKEEEFYTFSRVVIRQLTEEIEPILSQGKAVRVKVIKDERKRYIALAPPR